MIGRSHMGAGCEKRFRRCQIVVMNGPVQRRHAIGLGRVHLGMLFEQSANGSAIRFFDGISEAAVRRKRLKADGRKDCDEKQTKSLQ